jgi:hypothetical protein
MSGYDSSTNFVNDGQIVGRRRDDHERHVPGACLRERNDVPEADVDVAGDHPRRDCGAVGARYEGDVQSGVLEETLIDGEVRFATGIDRKRDDAQRRVLRSGARRRKQGSGTGR